MAASTHLSGPVMGTTEQRDTGGRPTLGVHHPGEDCSLRKGPCCHLLGPRAQCNTGHSSRWGAGASGARGAHSLRTSAEGTQVSPGLGGAAVAEL